MNSIPMLEPIVRDLRYASEERIRIAGCNGYIAKPLAYQDFLAVVANQLFTRSVR